MSRFIALYRCQICTIQIMYNIILVVLPLLFMWKMSSGWARIARRAEAKLLLLFALFRKRLTIITDERPYQLYWGNRSKFYYVY